MDVTDGVHGLKKTISMPIPYPVYLGLVPFGQGTESAGNQIGPFPTPHKSTFLEIKISLPMPETFQKCSVHPNHIGLRKIHFMIYFSNFVMVSDISVS